MGQSLSTFTWFAQIGQRWYRNVRLLVVGCKIVIVLQCGFEGVDGVLHSVSRPAHFVFLGGFECGVSDAQEPFYVGDCVIQGTQ